jgi:quercetin dioxygenase-like cupin family protein
MGTTRTGWPATDQSVTLDPATIGHLPWRGVPGCPGVRVKELWRRGEIAHALIAYEPGAATPGLPHPGADHYIWVVSGALTIGGRRLTAGSYVHIAPGIPHPIQAGGDDGCLLLQLHHAH